MNPQQLTPSQFCLLALQKLVEICIMLPYFFVAGFIYFLSKILRALSFAMFFKMDSATREMNNFFKIQS